MASHRAWALAERLRHKSWRTAALQGAQYTKLLWDHWTGAWRRQEARAEARWSIEAIDHFAAALRGNTQSLIGTAGISAAAEFLRSHPAQLLRLQNFRDAVLARQVEVFDQVHALPPWEEIDWCSDWRYEHRWPEAFHRWHNFYEFDKQAPYDVKFPWELSRLNFLLIPSLLAEIEGDTRWWPLLESILQSWRQGNRTGHSVNWYPMECAMRAVNLVQLAPLLVQDESSARAGLRDVLILCQLQGQFIYRSIEQGDVRGNHFAAEAVALLLLGLLLDGHVREAGKWLAYGRRHVEREILEQFYSDGVHFEKSTAYHRLVTELFLLAAIACSKAGSPLSQAACERLLAACRYTRAYTRADGSAPQWGDSDDARVLWFSHRPQQDHSAVLALGAALFDEPALASGTVPALEPVLLVSALSTGTSPQPGYPAQSFGHTVDGVQLFPEGGMVCAAFGRSRFIADVGEVGMRGRGGHGHLDALSFELALDGVPLIVDPGSFIYTGDCRARNAYRATRAHNVVRADGTEMATLFERRLWRLGSEADPSEVQLQSTPTGFTLGARHAGYRRLPSPVGYQRRWEWTTATSTLRITDRFQASSLHQIERYFHFAAGLDLELGYGSVTITSQDGRRFQITWTGQTKAALVPDHVSLSYATQTASQTLVLSNQIAGNCELDVEIGSIEARRSPLPTFATRTSRVLAGMAR